ncbi:hypothetical protein D3C87_1963350 [compost metagenome]
MKRIAVGLRIDGYGGNAKFAAGANDPDGDFAPIGNQHFMDVHVYPPKDKRLSASS